MQDTKRTFTKYKMLTKYWSSTLQFKPRRTKLLSHFLWYFVIVAQTMLQIFYRTVGFLCKKYLEFWQHFRNWVTGKLAEFYDIYWNYGHYS